MWHPFEVIPEGWPRAAVLAGSFVITAFVARWTNVSLEPRMVSLELAQTSDNANAIIATWKDSGQLANARLLQCHDDLFLLCYPIAIVLGCLFLSDLVTGWPHTLGRLLAWTAPATILLDFVENRAINRLLDGAVGSPWPQLAFACAAPKFVILFAAVAYVGVALLALVVQHCR